MTDHGRALTLAATAIDFTLDASEREALNEHLAACRTCRADTDAFAMDAHLVAALPAITPPSGVRASVFAPRARSRMWMLAAAALAIGLTLGALAVGAAVIDLQRDDLTVVPVPSSGPSRTPDTAPSRTPGASPSVDVAPQVGTVWTRVVDPDLVPEPRDSIAMDGVIAGGPGAIAWSWDAWDGPWIYTTTDGTDWTPARVEAVDDAISGRSGTVLDITSGGPGYVAVGDYASTRDAIRGVVWTSADGESWRRAPDDPAFDGASMSTVLPWRGEMLAYGASTLGLDSPPSVAWASPDGVTWGRVVLSLPDDLVDIGAPVTARDRLWALGVGPRLQEGRTVALLSSVDGRTWVIADAPWIGELHALDGVLFAVVWPEPSDLGLPGPAPSPTPAGMEPGLYRLDAPATSWQLVSGGLSTYADDLTSVDGTLVLVGADSSPCGQSCRPTGWRSTDGGRTWEVVRSDDIGSQMNHVAALPDGTLVAVGGASDGPARTTNAAWVSPTR